MTKKKEEKAQIERFKETARVHDADESDDALDKAFSNLKILEVEKKKENENP